MREPNYGEYSVSELKEALSSIDRDRWPLRAKAIAKEIEIRGLSSSTGGNRPTYKYLNYKKVWSSIAFVLMATMWINSIYEFHLSKDKLFEFSQTAIEKVEYIAVRNESTGQWIKVQDSEKQLIKDLLNELRKSEAVWGYRSKSPHESVVARVVTTDKTLDFDFYYHEDKNTPIKFDLVNRSYFGSSSFTQSNHGSFKSTGIHGVLSKLKAMR